MYLTDSDRNMESEISQYPKIMKEDATEIPAIVTIGMRRRENIELSLGTLSTATTSKHTEDNNISYKRNVNVNLYFHHQSVLRCCMKFR